jgi:hypothetical protein
MPMLGATCGASQLRSGPAPRSSPQPALGQRPRHSSGSTSKRGRSSTLGAAAGPPRPPSSPAPGLPRTVGWWPLPMTSSSVYMSAEMRCRSSLPPLPSLTWRSGAGRGGGSGGAPGGAVSAAPAGTGGGQARSWHPRCAACAGPPRAHPQPEEPPGAVVVLLGRRGARGALHRRRRQRRGQRLVLALHAAPDQALVDDDAQAGDDRGDLQQVACRGGGGGGGGGGGQGRGGGARAGWTQGRHRPASRAEGSHPIPQAAAAAKLGAPACRPPATWAGAHRRTAAAAAASAHPGGRRARPAPAARCTQGAARCAPAARPTRTPPPRPPPRPASRT